MSRRAYAGRVASSGVAAGTLRRDEVAKARRIPVTSVVGAIAATLGELRGLQANVGAIGSDILQFQIELLEDDTFVLEMLECVRAGAAPEAAVQQIFDVHIGGLASGGNDNFAARAADLADLRERLADSLRGYSAEMAQPPEDAILIADDMTPSRFLSIGWNRLSGLVTERGSPTSHVALLARSQGVPMLTGVGPVPPSCEGRPALLNGHSGELVVDPEAAELDIAAARPMLLPATDGADEGPVSLPNGERIRINLSVNSLAALDETRSDQFDGIGLVRTELLMPDAAALHRPDVQCAIYQRLLDWAGERPVTIRLFDAGGDKQLDGFTVESGGNPFLGLRGAGLLAHRPDILEVQLRAILAAAAGRHVRILVPMVTLPAQMIWFRNKLAEAAANISQDPAKTSLGMMVETPAAALDIDRFDVDFYALGTNDLIQYTMAAFRDSDASDLSEPIASPVIELIRKVVAHGRAKEREVSLCGDLAASPAHFGQLLDCGIRSFTMPARFAPRFRQFVRNGE